MHPEIERQMAAERVRKLRRAGAATRLHAATPRAAHEPEIVIREARPCDHLAIQALAVLDGAELPLGRVIVAEVRGSIVAALPLGSAPFSDPFRRTADLVGSVLEVERVDEAADVVELAGRRLRVVLGRGQGLDRGNHAHQPSPVAG